MIRMRDRTAAAVSALPLMLLAGFVSAATPQPTQRELVRAVNSYLAAHGDLCVGKFAWPRDVTAEDRQNQVNDAVQLPVLERLGLVTSTAIVAPPVAEGAASSVGLDSRPAPAAAPAEPDRRYSLTEKGRRYYLQKKRVTLGAHDLPTEHDADLCVAQLSLNRVVKWTPPDQVRGHLETLVSYSYRVKPADWLADPQAREVFPVVDHIIRGQGNTLMTVTVEYQDGHWVPVLPAH